MLVLTPEEKRRLDLRKAWRKFKRRPYAKKQRQRWSTVTGKIPLKRGESPRKAEGGNNWSR
jgi:hypothetical protein